MSNKIKIVKVPRHPAYKTIKAANRCVAEKLIYMKEVLSTSFNLTNVKR
jgi:hypothetical protein